MSDGTVAVEDRIGREVDFWIQELLDQSAKPIGFGKLGQIIAKFEVTQNVLYVRRESVQVILKVLQKLLLTGPRAQIAEAKTRCVVKRLSRSPAQRLTLFSDSGVVKHFIDVEDGLLSRFKHGIQPPQHAHREDHVAVFAGIEYVAQYVVRYVPDKRN